jgi:crossover junction endodeoxyribonuclease RuvC
MQIRSSERRVIGIDPGLTGGVVALDVDGEHVKVVGVRATPLLIGMRNKKPCNEYDVRAMHDLLADWVCDFNVGPVVVVLERASARPGQGVASMFRTGEGYGIWRGLIAAFPVEILLTSPQTWKRRMNLLGADKRASVLRAKEKFPQLATLKASEHGLAEAALIAAMGVGV